MSSKSKFVLLVIVLTVGAIGGQYFMQQILKPFRPSDLEITFKYGVKARNIFNTSAGTFTYDMVIDDPIVIQFQLTGKELDQIWESVLKNDFYNLTVFEEGPWSYSQSPVYTRILSIKADGYPDKTIKLVGPSGGPQNADGFLEISRVLIDIIENKPAYKALPEPRSGYA